MATSASSHILSISILGMKPEYESATSTGGIVLGDTVELVFYLEEIETGPEPESDQRGIPGFPYMSIILGLLTALVFHLRRKS